MPTLLDPIQLGAIAAPNRIVMAPLTRGRATRAFVPTELMVEYYRQRAAAGLIISEGTGISEEGLGWPYAPGLWTEEQTEAWKPVTEAVHQAGGRIVAQLWHMGRLVHPSYLSGAKPVSASANTGPGLGYTYDGKQPYDEARALEIAEMPRLMEDFRRAAANAIEAGFDGVQIHAANGYLIDSFLRDNANFRDDIYGGPVENRIRLLVETTEAVIDVVGAGRTSVRLSPNGDCQGVDDSNPHSVFPAAAKALSDLKIGFLEMREPGFDGTFGKAAVAPVAPAMQAVFDGPMILNSDYDPASGSAALAEGKADAIAFGRAFIANPDLVRRIAEGLPLNQVDPSTFYTQDEKGYTDYPAAEEMVTA